MIGFVIKMIVFINVVSDKIIAKFRFVNYIITVRVKKTEKTKQKGNRT